MPCLSLSVRSHDNGYTSRLPRPPQVHVGAGMKDNLWEQDGCHNCKHAFHLFEYDDGLTEFCTLNAPPRPKCGSVAMGEHWLNLSEGEYGNAMDKWEQWAKGRERKPWCVCDEWVQE